MRHAVPAIVPLPGNTSAVEALASSLHAEVAALSYSGPQSLTDAADLRQKAMALSEVMRRAGLDGTEALIAAREAERALGQMLAVGREAGDLASRGRDVGATNLTDLGIQPNLGADCSTLARLDDEEWGVLVDAARSSLGEAVSRSAFVHGARQIIAQRDAREAVRTTAAEHAREVAQAAQEAAQRLHALLTTPYVPSTPTLLADELRIEPPRWSEPAFERTGQPNLDAVDTSIDAQRHRAAVKVMNDLVTMLERTPPVLTDDVWTAVNVMEARRTVARLNDALALWVRMLNRQWDDMNEET